MKTEKYYKKKRNKIKEKNRDSKNFKFKSTKERKAFKENLKREYRSLKRSEKQDVRKHINRELE